MKIEIQVTQSDKGLFQAHSEFNQIAGALMAMLAVNQDSEPKIKIRTRRRHSRTRRRIIVNKKPKSIETAFPVFCQFLDQINDAVQQYAIT